MKDPLRKARRQEIHTLRAIKKQLPRVACRGHPTYIDNLELVYGQKLRTGVYEVTCPRFDTVVVAKSARFAWETPALHAGCTAYQWIESRDICPKLNSILVEEGRVLGFLMENIVDSRHADTEDLEMCQEGPIKAASN